MKKAERRILWPALGALLFLGTLLGVGMLTVQAQTSAPANPQSSERRIAQPTIWPPRPVPPPRPELGRELQLISQTAQVSIKGGVARTKLLQTFRNTANHTIEGTYVFPLPEGAAVSGFAMMVNGKRQEAEILDGDKAREIYTGIVQKMRDPAILEFIDRNLVRARIFPIAARAEQKIELEYSESLKAEGGAYRFVVPLRLPTGGAAQKATVDVRIESNEGIRAVYSPTHDVEVKRDGDTARISGEWGTQGSHLMPLVLRDEAKAPQNRSGSDRDFVLYYTTARERVGVNLVTHRTSDEDGYFMLLAAPDATIAPQEIAAKDVVFVFDTSGSMAGEKIEQARKALLNLLGNLNPNDRFNIVTFSSDVRTFRDGLTPVSTQNVEAARAFANEIKAVGGTNINDALEEALKMMKTSERPQQIVFMTDGQPTVGETDIAQILKNVRAANQVRFDTLTPTDEIAREAANAKARLFVFGVGFDVNTRLLDTLAEDNRGSSDYVLPQEDIEQKVGSLYAKIAYPVLANPRLDWGGMNVYDVYPKRMPDLFRGTQTVVFGRYKGSNAARVQLIGTSRGREERVSGSGSFGERGQLNDTLPRLWAVRKVGYLLDDARREGRTPDKEVQDEIIKLSKRYGIVTPLTAGLITEDGDGATAPRPLSAGGFPGAPTGGRHRESAADALSSRVPAMSAMPARGQLFAAQSGAGAVAASKTTGAMREARQVKDEANVRYIEGKAFFLKNGVWTDGDYDAAKSPKPVTIKAFSPEYISLLKDAKIAKWLSVGERVIIVLNDKTIKVEP